VASTRASGVAASYSHATGNENTATGAYALYANTTGGSNTASGLQALYDNATGNDNTATGVAALVENITGSDNTAIGFRALLLNTIDNSNIAIGVSAGVNLTTGVNNIDIGNAGAAGEFGRIRIGTQRIQTATFIAGITDVAVTGSQVIVSPNGRLGITTSSKRFKNEIKPMDNASAVILALRPVTFRYKHDLDPEGNPQFGLVAEEVEKVNPDLVARDDQGKPYTVRYEAVNAMLLNEFLKEHRKVEQQRKDFESALAQQQRQIDALTAGLQKVSAQLELNKAAPKTVLNNH
jgi:hypothetical protein